MTIVTGKTGNDT